MNMHFKFPQLVIRGRKTGICQLTHTATCAAYQRDSYIRKHDRNVYHRD